MRRVAVFLAVVVASSPALSDGELDQKLYEAVNSFDASAVASHIAAGADVDSVHAVGYTPLMRAAEIGQADLVRLLLDGGANPNLRDRNGRSAAEIAIEADSVEVIEALLEGGADFDARDSYDQSLVLRVVESGRESAYAILDAFGRYEVDVNVGNERRTPLYHAVEQGDAQLVSALLRAGADPSLASGSGALPLSPALSNPEVLDLLLKAGADPNGIDRDGNPVLFEALFAVSIEAAEALIKAGADVDRPGADGRSALERARSGPADDIATFLESVTTSGEALEPPSSTPQEPVSQSADTVPTDDEYPRMADLPFYPGAETMFVSDDVHAANFVSDDPVPTVAKVTEDLLMQAGWKDAKHPHAKREKDRNYVMLTKGPFLLITDIGIARAMGDRTGITYSIIPKNSSFGKIN